LNPYIWALVGTGITFLATVLGAAVVFIVPKVNESFNRACMGFAAGIMVAASLFSLLIPSMEITQTHTALPVILPVAGGFVIGGAFLFVLDKVIPHLHPGNRKAEGPVTGMKRTSLLVSAVTLHNIPEGMAVGLAFSLAAAGDAAVTLAGAFALAIGMAIQNFPEGAAISLPLRQEGYSKPKAFLIGALSGIVEPIGGILLVLLAGALTPVLPWFLSFAAGAMIYVVVDELIPTAVSGEHSNVGVLSFMGGFLIMMILDITLG
jgi:ZIP family zinc transporter